MDQNIWIKYLYGKIFDNNKIKLILLVSVILNSYSGNFDYHSTAYMEFGLLGLELSLAIVSDLSLMVNHHKTFTSY